MAESVIDTLPPDDDCLRGLPLRYVLLDELRGRPSMTVAEMVNTLARHGYELAGRASKVISDALRWEVRRGRVERIGRGVYRHRPTGTPRSTMRRVTRFADRARAWIVARTSGQPLPLTPANPRLPPGYERSPAARTERPPWFDHRWLWAT